MKRLGLNIALLIAHWLWNKADRFIEKYDYIKWQEL